ncbi:MAG: hypothetical protein AB2A00_06440 [Myxococcota bacterium]
MAPNPEAPLRLNEIEWGPPLLPDALTPELEALCKRLFGGVVPNVFRKIAPVPWLVEMWMALMRRRHTCAPRELIDLLCFISAQENSCRYCYGGQRASLRLMGYPEKRVQQLENRVELEQLSALERAVVQYAATLVRMTRRPTRADREVLERAGLTSLQVAELTYLVALSCASTRMSTLAATPPDADYEALPDKLIIRLLRPLIATQMRPERRDAAPVAEGPFARVLAPLEQTWGAQLLRKTLDGLLGEGPLPRRSKLLILLTTAHALECPVTRAECVRLLAEEGITAAQADEVTTHLSSPVLDPLEARLVPLARDSIRYKPVTIQARVRDLTAGMEPRVILDVLGATAVGNALGRLGTLS